MNKLSTSILVLATSLLSTTAAAAVRVSSGNATTVCDVLGDDVPSYCSCKDEALGGILNCTVPIVGKSSLHDEHEYSAH
jgi:hypothetical protein